MRKRDHIGIGRSRVGSSYFFGTATVLAIFRPSFSLNAKLPAINYFILTIVP